jgi:hypothetical protein
MDHMVIYQENGKSRKDHEYIAWRAMYTENKVLFAVISQLLKQKIFQCLQFSIFDREIIRALLKYGNESIDEP